VAIVGKFAQRRRYEVEIEPREPMFTVGSGDAFLRLRRCRHRGYPAGVA
jgi:hypothetical protein